MRTRVKKDRLDLGWRQGSGNDWRCGREWFGARQTWAWIWSLLYLCLHGDDLEKKAANENPARGRKEKNRNPPEGGRQKKRREENPYKGEWFRKSHSFYYQ